MSSLTVPIPATLTRDQHGWLVSQVIAYIDTLEIPSFTPIHDGFSYDATYYANPKDVKEGVDWELLSKLTVGTDQFPSKNHKERVNMIEYPVYPVSAETMAEIEKMTKEANTDFVWWEGKKFTFGNCERNQVLWPIIS